MNAILEILKRGNHTAREIARELNLTLPQVYQQLVRLESLGCADCHVLTEPRRAIWYRT